MVTLTVRHEDGTPLKPLLDGTLKAWRGVRQGGAIQRIWTERVTATIRATEITHGAHGWHPHIHVLIRSTEWTDDEREALLRRWQDMVRKHLGEKFVPSDSRAIDWGDAIDMTPGAELGPLEHARTRYLFTLGLEIAGAKHARRKGSRESWQIADDASRGDARSIALWREYSRATRGKRMIELDDRAARFAKMLDPNADMTLHDSTLLRVEVPVHADDLALLRHIERRSNRAVFATILQSVAVAQCPETAVKQWLWLCGKTAQYTRSDGQGYAPPTEYHDTA